MKNQINWKRFCDYIYQSPTLGISVDISKMHFPDPFFKNIKEGLNSALDEMKAIESGEIANSDEKRMVGHYWLRNTEIAPLSSIKRTIEFELKKIKHFSKQIKEEKIKPLKKERFTQAIIIGIGGSALGPQLLSDALWEEHHKITLHFVDNTDPDGIKRLLKKLKGLLDETLVLIISKSGGTIETRNGTLEIKKAFKDNSIDYTKHFVAITQEESKLDIQAKEENWLNQFYIWDWIGGRTSIFSAVGLLPAALQGIDIDKFLEGAKKMDIETRKRDILKNPACLLSSMWWHAGGGKGVRDMVLIPYKDRLLLFSRYMQQLVMESLGKELDREGKIVNQGLSVYGNKGSTDQHAYVQQLRDGLNNFFVTFIEVNKDLFNKEEQINPVEVEEGITTGDYLSAFFQGTRLALENGERESITITLDALTPFTLGALIALYDRAVGIYASLIDINAYHQPGVEAGKKAASNIIEIQTKVINYLKENRGMKFTSVEISNNIEKKDEIETIFKILEHLSSNSNTKISRSEERHPLQATYMYLPIQ